MLSQILATLVGMVFNMVNLLWIFFKVFYQRNEQRNIISADVLYESRVGIPVALNRVKLPALPHKLREGIRRYSRKNFLNKYYVIDKDNLKSGGFGSVSIVHLKPIGPLRVESEKYAMKKINVQKSKIEAEFHENFAINTRWAIRTLDFWFEDSSKSPSTECSYIKMELCGENLREGIKKIRKSFEHNQASKVAVTKLAVFILHIFQELLMACFVLHQEIGFSIGDLKPDNVLFSMTGIKLCDFGFMRFKNPISDGANQARFGGTPLYQPPNERKFETISNQIRLKRDMYAMGLILFELFYEINGIEQLKITFENLKLNRELPEQLKNKWPEVCEIILNLTQNELDKIDTAQEAIFTFNKLWEKDIFSDAYFPDSPITIKDGTPFLNKSVNIWKDTFNVMQQCSWQFCSKEDKFSKMFTLAGQKKNDNFLCVSDVSLGTSHIGFLRLKQLVNNNESYDQIARELKQLYDEQVKYWHCFVSDDKNTAFKVFRDEFVYLGYCNGKKSVEAFLCTSRYVGLDKLKKLAREIKVIQDKRNISKNSVDIFVEEKCVAFSNQRKEYKNDGDYNEAFVKFLSAQLISAYGKQWNCIVGSNIFHCITGQYSGAVLQRTFEGRQIVVFKMKKQPLVQFDHSTYATICHYLNVPAKSKVKSSDQLPKERLPVEDILHILKVNNSSNDRKLPNMPLQIMCHHGGECSFNKNVTSILLECSPQFKMSMSIWKTVPAKYVQVTENIGDNILRLIKENNSERIAPIIRTHMMKNYGGEWFCFVVDTNGFQFVIYHNGNLFNFLVGDLEIVLYQPGLKEFKSDYAEETDPKAKFS